ncbi:MAG: 3-deoxy-D-manno-octulosonic acid transferase, partial [Verrucomicrobia bacterium]|nr:3-deoxy-D-manno-octulosonic acid transferase [Verrucomicrobiota bacterium]
MPLLLLLYNLLFAPVFLLLLPGYLARMIRRGGWRAGFGQRFGFYPKTWRARLAAEPTPRLWIQAVSV